MKMLAFAARCRKEMLRDPLTLAFGIGFPVVLLLLLSAIQANIPVPLFVLDQLTPGIAIFGLSFISLFSAQLISKDRCGSFLMRLFATPMTAMDFILGYTLPLVPMALAQMAVCFLCAFILGLTPSWNVLLCLAVLLPAAVLFIAIGLLCGTLLTDKQVGGICGALLTNLSAWLSGTWFDLSLVGGVFQKIAYALPFARAVDAGRAALNGDLAGILPQLWWVAAYAVVLLALAIFFFARRMRNGKGA